MKKIRKKEHKSLKILRFIVIVLFILLLFAPKQIDRPVIASIAIAGTIGSILFLLLPMLPRLSAPTFLKKFRFPHDQHPRETEPEHGTYDLETLLIRQISFQITDKMKAAYPEAAWEFQTPLTAEHLLKGRSFRVRTLQTGNYNFAEITMDKYGHLNVSMMTLKSLTPQKDTQASTPGAPVHVDPEAWYSLIGRPLLMDLITDLQARGHQKLFINESGEIFILNGNTPEVKNTFEHFPPKDYWAALTDIFIKDELKAKETNNTLELSWM